jgi:hypothetical protein
MWPVWFFTTFAQTSANRSIERTIEILSGQGKFTDPDVVQALDLLFQFGRDKMFSASVFGLDFGSAQTELQTGKACFYLFHDSIAKPLVEANPPNFDLDFMLMPNLVGKPVTSQYPGGPGVVLSIPAHIDPKRKKAALDLIDFLTSDASDRESIELNGELYRSTRALPRQRFQFTRKKKPKYRKWSRIWIGSTHRKSRKRCRTAFRLGSRDGPRQKLSHNQFRLPSIDSPPAATSLLVEVPRHQSENLGTPSNRTAVDAETIW